MELFNLNVLFEWRLTKGDVQVEILIKTLHFRKVFGVFFSGFLIDININLSSIHLAKYRFPESLASQMAIKFPHIFVFWLRIVKRNICTRYIFAIRIFVQNHWMEDTYAIYPCIGKQQTFSARAYVRVCVEKNEYLRIKCIIILLWICCMNPFARRSSSCSLTPPHTVCVCLCFVSTFF